MPESSPSICPNCSHENSPGYNFCEECGQKNRPIKITFYEFISEFISIVFNLENKFWKTIKYLFIPGKLTHIFYLGKRKSFYHPLRLYLVSVIAFFAVLSILKLDQVLNFNGSELNMKNRHQERVLLTDQKKILTKTLDSLKVIYPRAEQREVIDSISNELFLVYREDTSYIKNESKLDSSSFTMFQSSIRYSTEELFNKDIDEVVESKNLDNFFERLFFRQFLKGSRDLGSLNNYIFANLTWLFLAIIPIFSLILKLFYIRRKRLYMEHFVFLLHLFTAVIFISNILMLTLIPLDQKTIFATSMTLIVTIFPYLAFKSYYKQGWFKTLVKFIMVGFLFFIAFTLTFVFFILITAVLF